MEQKFNILTWFKNLADAWKIGATIVGAVITIGYTAIKIDHWVTKGVKQENVVEYLKQEDIKNKKLKHINDSIEIKHWADLYIKLGFYSDSLRLLFTNTQTLTNAVGTIGSKMTSTVPDLFKLMGGLQFKIVEEVQEKSVYPGAIIKYMKIDTTKRK
jgi:hypothetical protein